MKKDVLITIKGEQDIEGEMDVVELLTAGTFYRKNKTYYLAYQETDESGFEGQTTTLKVEPNQRVTMTRLGNHCHSQLVVEPGIRHQCHYDTGYGDLTVGIMGDCFDNTLTDSGGSLAFGYSMDINTSLACINKVTILVE